MAHPIDLHVGLKLRQRRCLLGLTQQKLAAAVGIKFQQIQKYESGANRVSASRLWTLASALDVPVSYFFDDIGLREHPQIAATQGGSTPGGAHQGAQGFAEPVVESNLAEGQIAPGVMSNKETIDLVRAYYQMKDGPRRRLLDLAKTLALT